MYLVFENLNNMQLAYELERFLGHLHMHFIFTGFPNRSFVLIKLIYNKLITGILNCFRNGVQFYPSGFNMINMDYKRIG